MFDAQLAAAPASTSAPASPSAPAPSPAPAPSDAPDPRAVTAAALRDAPPPRVLLCEDDALQGRGLLRLLRARGADARLVSTAEAALQAIAADPPYDLVLSDLHLPGAPGTALPERLRQPLLVCYTGSAATPPGFDRVLRKPALRELLHLLRAPHLRLLLLQGEDGRWHARAPSLDLACAGPTPAQALRVLAHALERDALAAPAGHA